jgi:hypothetical protein
MQERFREHVLQPGTRLRRTQRRARLPAARGQRVCDSFGATTFFASGRYTWQWPATFIEIYLPRLIEMGCIDQEFAEKVRADLATQKQTNSVWLRCWC